MKQAEAKEKAEKEAKKQAKEMAKANRNAVNGMELTEAETNELKARMYGSPEIIQSLEGNEQALNAIMQNPRALLETLREYDAQKEAAMGQNHANEIMQNPTLLSALGLQNPQNQTSIPQNQAQNPQTQTQTQSKIQRKIKWYASTKGEQYGASEDNGAEYICTKGGISVNRKSCEGKPYANLS